MYVPVGFMFSEWPSFSSKFLTLFLLFAGLPMCSVLMQQRGQRRCNGNAVCLYFSLISVADDLCSGKWGFYPAGAAINFL